MQNSEKPFISIASTKDGPAGSCKFGVNNAATGGKFDADLTQPVSPSVRPYREALRPVIRKISDRLDAR